MTGSPFPELRNGAGERLDHAFVPAAGANADGGSGRRPPLAIVAHGVTSAHDRDYLVALGAACAARGLDVVRLTFAGNGASEGRFEEATPRKEAGDLAALLDAAAAAGYVRVGYAGHSMGGAVGVLRAAEDPRIGALVSLAGMFHVARFFERVAGALRYGELLLGKPGCRWSEALHAEARALGSLHDAAARVAVPWLLLHGTADELVPIHDSFDARAAAAMRPELVALSGAGHRFETATDSMARHAATFLTTHL